MNKVQGGEGAATRAPSKPPPAQVTGHRAKQAYHKWAQEARAEEEEAEAQAAARGAASSSRPRRVLATRAEATIVLDWHNVLDKAWVENKHATWSTARGTHGYFKPAFTDALRAFVVEHRPMCVAILSYCSRASARWYEVHFLQEAVDCLHRLLPTSTRVRFGQTYQRTGPEGKSTTAVADRSTGFADNRRQQVDLQRVPQNRRTSCAGGQGGRRRPNSLRARRGIETH